ncbi:MAG: tRNA pseudouridine(55) synthase TruB [Planctomycetes bacterium]|nr:tRNA pseudouridine(55) synthase TruB [Planctomycetota bacterium]
MGRKRKRGPEAPTGILLVAKPRGPTSREVVEQVERRLGLRGLGHCGTLDPLATGLLVLVSGRAGRLQDRLTGHDKRYRALVRLGERSATDDSEGPIWPVVPTPTMPERGRLEEVLRSFLGEIDQRPPAHSALRIDGERSWKKARRGEQVELPSRRVRIDRIEVQDYRAPDLLLEVDCGPGTYLRSLARDLGELLGLGGRLETLERSRSGPFELSAARDPDAVSLADLLPLELALASLPRAVLDAGDLRRLLDGREVQHRGDDVLQDDALVWLDGRIIGRARKLSERGFRLRRLVVEGFEECSDLPSGSDRMSAPSPGEKEP